MNMNAPVGEELADLRKKAQEDIRRLRSTITQLDQVSLDLILTRARSHYAWKAKPVTDDQIHRIYEIAKMGPTSMNSCPARFTWLKSKQGRERLAKSLKPKNVPKVMDAPLTVIVAYDIDFWKQLPKLFPHEERRHLYDGFPEYTLETAFRNSTLQGCYLMIAARAIGLDVGAMSGFSNKSVDEEFFAGTTLRSNFLVNMGYAEEDALFQRLPRFAFDDVCSFA